MITELEKTTLRHFPATFRWMTQPRIMMRRSFRQPGKAVANLCLMAVDMCIMTSRINLSYGSGYLLRDRGSIQGLKHHLCYSLLNLNLESTAPHGVDGGMCYCSHNANSREVKESPQVKSGIVRILRMSSNALRQYKRTRLRGRKRHHVGGQRPRAWYIPSTRLW